ncbi:MAG: 6-bladed beta-propeller, partial [Candidatus Aminicenantes bacterium]|nr:6-bladed beta-propeller [Candidatus Aminicenantes bacterium]
FIIEEELSIERKSTEPKEEMFQNIVSLVIDDAGNIYVLDKKAANIKIFNKDGNFLKIIGRRGEGPGEFIAPEKGSLSSNNELYIYDWGRSIIQVIDTDGKFIKQMHIQTPWFDGPKFLSDGKLVASLGVVGENIKFNLNKFNTSMEPILTYASIPMLKPPKVNTFVFIFNADLKWDVGPGSEIIWGAITTPEYELFIHDKDGKYIKKITKQYSPVKLTTKEYKKLMKKWFGKVSYKQFDFVIPKNYPPFQGFILDGEGRIFVHRFVEVEKSNKHYFDVFDDEGKYTTKITLDEKFLFGTFKNKKLYTIEEDEDGYKYVRCYKVTWNY